MVGQANAAAVRSELSNLEAGIASFHSAYGTNPPSFLDLTLNTSDGEYAAGAGFANPRTLVELKNVFGNLLSEAQMTQSLAATGFYNSQGSGDDGGRLLRGAECLVFFLGGMPAGPAYDNSGNLDTSRPSKELAGFSDDPRDPFKVVSNGGGSFSVPDKGRRMGPFFEFEPGRLVYPDEAGEGNWFMYVDRFSGQQTPIMYSRPAASGSRPRPTRGTASGRGCSRTRRSAGRRSRSSTGRTGSARRSRAGRRRGRS